MGMTAKQQEQATLAFKEGYAARNNGKGYSSRLTAKKGINRDFWEEGWHKADKEIKDKYDAERPARIAAAKARNAKIVEIVQDSVTNAMFANVKVDKLELLSIRLNAEFGITTTYNQRRNG